MLGATKRLSSVSANKIAELVHELRCLDPIGSLRVYMDATGIGDPVLEDVAS